LHGQQGGDESRPYHRDNERREQDHGAGDDEHEAQPAERVGRSREPQRERADQEQETEEAVIGAAARAVDARASREELREQIAQE
jgi:hypothetical protein